MLEYVATNSMADATYLKAMPKQLHVTHGQREAGRLSLIIPNGSTHGPPTSSAVQVNLGDFAPVTDSVPC